MDYSDALVAGGCEVLEYESFGSYQGDWWAVVLHDGVTKLIHGYFGSCSGCDAIQAEFDYVSHDHYVDGLRQYFYDFNIKAVDMTCAQCLDIGTRFIAFGKQYVDDAFTPEEAVKAATQYSSWDSDAQEVIKWLKSAMEKHGIEAAWPEDVKED